MVTRGNGLLFNLRSAMKFFQCKIKFMAIRKNRFIKKRNSVLSFRYRRFLHRISNLKNKVYFFFFNNRKRIDKFTNMGEPFPLTNPSITGFTTVFRGLFGGVNSNSPSKISLNPIWKPEIGVGNLQSSLVIITSFMIGSVFGNNQTALTIDDSSKINNCISLWYNGNICGSGHKNSFCRLKYSYFNKLNNKCQAAETNREGALLSEVIVRTLGKLNEGGITRLPASFEVINYNKVVSNSNRTLINQDPVLNEAVARLGQSMRETEDELCRDMLAGTASVINCTNGVNGDNPTEFTRADVDNVVATLQNNDADFITNMIGGEDKFGTGPVRDAYFGLCDTRMIGQLENANGFINKAQYPNQTGVMSSEWGSVGNVRFYLSSRGSVTVGASLLGADIYNVFIGGQESYAKVEQNGVSAKFIYHPPGHGDDPSELRQTASWRMAQVPRITNDAWIISLRCTLG